MNIPVITGLRSAPPEWEARLREVDPIRDKLSHLELVWDETSERWWLFEMVPAYLSEHGPTVPPEILKELKGEDPDTIPETAPLISRRQWLLYAKTGRWARPCWIIQGSRGGHYYAYDKPTTELCKFLRLPLTPPKSGQLPYAPFDERVVSKILDMSRFVRAQNDFDRFRSEYTGDGAKRTYQEALRKVREQYIQFLDNEAEEDAEHFIDAHRKGEFVEKDVRTDATDWQKADEELNSSFIDTGMLTRPTDL